ncbi:MAG: tRNA 2-selenouridine(34) synthase MnmH [Chitinophagales bacterium]|nr:tRNA 2-selenouridine(34) synthase MnmH [Chitinophagales bacterium]
MLYRYKIISIAVQYYRLVNKLTIENFLIQSENHLITDVRSPSEYAHGHIPGAVNIPLFSDEERKRVGTIYKNMSREKAMLEGLNYFGKNMQQIIADLTELTTGKNLYAYCWRGGMRSGVVSWMLDLFGYKVCTLNNGYKSFRNYVLNSYSVPKSFLVVGGKTGSAKTKVLQVLKRAGQQTLDLEAMANHKGSAFGDLGEPASPTQEQFENQLCFQLQKLNPLKPIWIEDESQRIGFINIPNPLWTQMRNADVIYLDVPFEERLKNIVEVYGQFDVQLLKASTIRIQKKLGGLNTKSVLQFFEEGKLENAFFVLLSYYDKMYDKATSQRDPGKVFRIFSKSTNAAENADLILNYMKLKFLHQI